MKIFILLFLLAATSAYPCVGTILKIHGTNNGFIQRGDEKVQIAADIPLELNDSISSMDSHIVLHVFPGTQISLAKNTELKISQHLLEENKKLAKSFSVIDFIKGLIRVQVAREAGEELEQKIQAKDVSFAVRGTEFEVSYSDLDVDLDVMEGEVVVSSPHIHSFVPEVVKANEGFRFNRKQKVFARRKFSPKFNNHPGFLKREKLLEKWKLKKERLNKLGKKKIRKKRRTRD